MTHTVQRREVYINNSKYNRKRIHTRECRHPMYHRSKSLFELLGDVDAVVPPMLPLSISSHPFVVPGPCPNNEQRTYWQMFWARMGSVGPPPFPRWNVNNQIMKGFPSLSGWNQLQRKCMGGSSSSSSSSRSMISIGMEERLERICRRHEELVEQLMGDRTSLTPQQLAKLGKEASDLEDIVEKVKMWKKAKHELQDLFSLRPSGISNLPEGKDKYVGRQHDSQRLSTEAGSSDSLVSMDEEDEDFLDLVEEERAILEKKIPHIERELILSLLPKDEADARGVVIEVRAGTGGEEACLFAGELFRMYERYVALHGWKFELAEFTTSDLGGCKLAIATVSSQYGSGGVFGRLKFESGVHRVQRVPSTESGGRVHTSAASVAILPIAEEVDLDIRDDDLRIDVYRSGGAGGQHVNTTNSAVRITHIPTGTTVCIQDERSQHKNKAKALTVLRSRLFDAERRRIDAETSFARRALIGSGDRSERIRTYNFPQGRVTDHRISLTEHDVQGILTGEKLDIFVEALQLQHQADLLGSLEADE